MEWINYNHLLYFWLVAREGSVSRAAQLLHVTQPTVSTQVRALEKALKARLFTKSGRHLVLTDTGTVVYRYADEIFSLGRELLDSLAGLPVGRPLVLRVGLVDVMPKLVAYRLLEPALRPADQLRVVCREGKLDRLVAELTVHNLDVVLSDTPLDPAIKARVYNHPLRESEVSIMGVPKLAKLYTPGFPKSLDKAPFLMQTDNTVLRRALDFWCETQGIFPIVRGEFEDSAMLKIAGREGDGLFAVPSIIEDDVCEMYGVRVVGRLSEVRERFFALSVERKLKHPAVVAIYQAAHQVGSPAT